MAITRVGQGTGTNTASLPTLAVDDIIVVGAYRDGNTTPPTLASSFTNIINGGANTNSMRVGWRRVVTGTETVGTWTNATSVIAVVYRGVNPTSPIGGTVQTGGASTVLNYGTITVQDTLGENVVVLFGAHRSTDVSIENAPIVIATLITSVSDATDEMAAFEMPGVTSGPFVIGTVNVFGTSSGWRTAAVELLPAVAAVQYTQTNNITSSGSVGAVKAAGLIEAVTSSGAVSRALSAGKQASIAGLSSISRAFGISRAIGVASAGAVASVKAMARTLSVATGSAVSAVASRAYLLALAISSAASVSAQRSVGKTSAITGVASVTARKGIGKGLGLASDGLASIRKAAGKMASVLPTSSVATQKAIGAQMAVSAVSAVSAVKSLSARLSVASSGVVSASKTVATVVGFVSVALVASVAQYIETAYIEPAAKRIASVSREIREAVIEPVSRSAFAQGVSRVASVLGLSRIKGSGKRK